MQELESVSQQGVGQELRQAGALGLQRAGALVQGQAQGRALRLALVRARGLHQAEVLVLRQVVELVRPWEARTPPLGAWGEARLQGSALCCFRSRFVNRHWKMFGAQDL